MKLPQLFGPGVKPANGLLPEPVHSTVTDPVLSIQTFGVAEEPPLVVGVVLYEIMN
jgi:hypothetical protein